MAKTTKPLVVEQNVETGEVIEREMTAAEYERHLADKAITEANLAAAEAKEAERQTILNRLGITADEAKLILG
jgi:hypothetical protein